METTQLIPNVSIEAVLLRRSRAEELAQTIETATAELEEMSRAGDGVTVPSVVLDSHNMGRKPATVENVMKVVDAGLWEWMLQRSGLWTFMDAKARTEWLQQKDKFDFPPMTTENVAQAFEHIHTTRGDMMSRGVDELFQRLSRSHKTNTGTGFTKKVIVEHMCSVWGTGAHRHLSVNHHSTSELDDLNRVLHVLRGTPEPEWQASNGYSRIRDAVDEGFKSGNMVAKFPFFEVRVFKKGTGHIVFRFDEDVKRLNKVLSIRYGGMRIATPRHEK